MRNLKIEYNGKTYQYICSVLDVFSRFHWLVLVQSKHSRKVKSKLKKIFDENGNPRTLQGDGGKEFLGEVKTFSKKTEIRMTKSTPYYP